MDDRKPDNKRRSFLKLGLTGLAASGLPLAGGLGASNRPGTAAGRGRTPAGDPIRRTLGKTGLSLPVVSMGVMNADNPNLVQAALDSGIFLLDTAHGYQRGRNEQMIGQVIKGRPRDSYAVATKVPDPATRKGGELSAAEAGKAFLERLDISLGRLGLDHVDIFYVHDVSTREDAQAPHILEALRKAKADGKTRFVGFSTHRNEPVAIRAAVESGAYDVILTSYNFRQDHRDEMRRAIAEAAAAGIGIVAMKTQAGAFWDKERQEPINMTAALKWVLNDPNVTTAIPGFTTFDQLETDMTVVTDLKLTPAELKDLRLDEGEGGLYCQACGQCEGTCPTGLPFPELMRSYMYAYGYRNLGAARELVASLDVPGNPCGDCAACTARCAKGFVLADRVRDIVRLRAVPADFLA